MKRACNTWQGYQELLQQSKSRKVVRTEIMEWASGVLVVVGFMSVVTYYFLGFFEPLESWPLAPFPTFLRSTLFLIIGSGLMAGGGLLFFYRLRLWGRNIK